jgi:hypothetical protein
MICTSKCVRVLVLHARSWRVGDNRWPRRVSETLMITRRSPALSRLHCRLERTRLYAVDLFDQLDDVEEPAADPVEDSRPNKRPRASVSRSHADVSSTSSTVVPHGGLAADPDEDSRLDSQPRPQSVRSRSRVTNSSPALAVSSSGTPRCALRYLKPVGPLLQRLIQRL